MRGAVTVLLALSLAWATSARGDSVLMLSPGEPEDVYVCVDPAKPDVSLSSTDCASGTPDVATVTIHDSTTGMEIIVHVKACLEGGCAVSVCVNAACDPACLTSTVCAEVTCRWGHCDGSCPAGVFCWHAPRHP